MCNIVIKCYVLLQVSFVNYNDNSFYSFIFITNIRQYNYKLCWQKEEFSLTKFYLPCENFVARCTYAVDLIVVPWNGNLLAQTILTEGEATVLAPMLQTQGTQHSYCTHAANPRYTTQFLHPCCKPKVHNTVLAPMLQTQGTQHSSCTHAANPRYTTQFLHPCCKPKVHNTVQSQSVAVYIF